MKVMAEIEEKDSDRTLEDYYKLDINFHKCILMMSGNNAILQAWNNIASVIYTLLSVNASREYKERYVIEFEKKHKDIMSQIILRDKACIDSLQQHIEDAKILTLGVIKDIEEGTYRY
jgi:DNA-binding GntR family transcriptional regulator